MIKLDLIQIDRVIEMAWEDRTPFEAISFQFGLTEKEAKSQKIDIKVGKFPFVANGKAIALGEPEGLVKTIFNKTTGELIGAHMVGPEVTELIQGFSIAKKLETTEYELMHTIFPHPTLSEAMHESVLDAYDQAIHY